MDSHVMLNLEVLAATVLDLFPFPAFIASVPSGRLLRWNRAAIERCGSDLLASASLPALLQGGESHVPLSTSEPVLHAVRNGSSVMDVDAILRTGSSPLPVAVSVQPVGHGGDEANAVLVLCYPTDRWTDAARALRRNEDRLAIALSAARLGAWEFDLRTRVLTTSAQCKANHGFAADEDMQFDSDIVSAVHDDYRARFTEAIQRAIDTHGSFEIEVPHRWRDGSEHWLLVSGRLVDPTCMVGVSGDITDRRRIEQSLRESEQQYRALVDAANEGIWQLDPDARIIFVNQRMADLLAVTPEAMLGRHKWDFVFDDDVGAMRGLFERRKRGVSEEVADIRFRRADGREVWTLMAARPLYDALGRFVGAVDLFTDITERRRAEEQLRDSDRRKDEFLAVLAHELRGPLAPIIIAVKLLQAKGSNEPPLQKFRDTILRQTLQLSTLVDDLLDVGRITAGKLRLEKTRVDLRDVVTQAVEVSGALVERRRHTLRVQLPDRPVYLEADAARLVQVAGNLLSNAAKYMRDGGQIDIAVREESGMGVVSVRDQGVGISPEMLDRIFDRFVQVVASEYRSEGGLGIGLSIVKALVDLHEGTIEAHSAGIGKGSEFTFRLPVAPANEAAVDVAADPAYGGTSL
jgi:PAS domain S-box-containing protein